MRRSPTPGDGAGSTGRGIYWQIRGIEPTVGRRRKCVEAGSAGRSRFAWRDDTRYDPDSVEEVPKRTTASGRPYTKIALGARLCAVSAPLRTTDFRFPDSLSVSLPRPLRALRTAYRATVPDAVRYPIGHARRAARDRWIRLTTTGPPLPPRRLLRSVQMTPWIWEYLRVGRVTAETVRRAFEEAPFESVGHPGSPEGRPTVLDFGCGLGRTLRFLRDVPWDLHGCDVDGESIAWARGALPEIRFEPNAHDPPLPYPAGAFDAAYAISVFTHFDAEAQQAWSRELARVVRPGGLAFVTTMGTHALGHFPNLDTEENRRRLEQEGFLYRPGGEAFNARGAFHAPREVERLFAGHHFGGHEGGFDLVRHEPAGVDGFQDFTLLRRKARRKAAATD